MYQLKIYFPEVDFKSKLIENRACLRDLLASLCLRIPSECGAWAMMPPSSAHLWPYSYFFPDGAVDGKNRIFHTSFSIWYLNETNSAHTHKHTHTTFCFSRLIKEVLNRQRYSCFLLFLNKEKDKIDLVWSVHSEFRYIFLLSKDIN